MRRPALGRPAGPAPSGRRPQTAVVRALSLMPPMLKCGHRGRKRRFHAKRHSAPAETALPLSARSDSAGEAKATSSVETRARESCDADPDRLAQQRTRHVEVDQGQPHADRPVRRSPPAESGRTGPRTTLMASSSPRSFRQEGYPPIRTGIGAKSTSCNQSHVGKPFHYPELGVTSPSEAFGQTALRTAFRFTRSRPPRAARLSHL
jgi:hypothetical protein